MLLLHYGHWWTDSVTVRPSLSLRGLSHFFLVHHVVNSSMSVCPGSIEVVRFHFIDWLTIGQEEGHLLMCTGGCWSFSSLANVHIWLNMSMTYPVQGSWWLWCFRINWVAKTIWSAKRKMWIVPRMSFGFSNLSSYFWISPLPPPRGSIRSSLSINPSMYVADTSRASATAGSNRQPLYCRTYSIGFNKSMQSNCFVPPRGPGRLKSEAQR